MTIDTSAADEIRSDLMSCCKPDKHDGPNSPVPTPRTEAYFQRLEHSMGSQQIADVTAPESLLRMPSESPLQMGPSQMNGVDWDVQWRLLTLESEQRKQAQRIQELGYRLGIAEVKEPCSPTEERTAKEHIDAERPLAKAQLHDFQDHFEKLLESVRLEVERLQRRLDDSLLHEVKNCMQQVSIEQATALPEVSEKEEMPSLSRQDLTVSDFRPMKVHSHASISPSHMGRELHHEEPGDIMGERQSHHQQLSEITLDNAIDYYAFQPSIFDVIVFLGIRSVMKPLDCVQISIAFIIALGTQLLMSYILLFPAFSDTPLTDSFLRNLDLWRHSDAHSSVYGDPRFSSSLISRVCNLDPTLTVGTNQYDLYGQLVAYTESGGGQMLSIAVIAYFTVICAEELRQIFDCAFAFHALPRAWLTRIYHVADGYEIRVLSSWRFVLVAFVLSARLFVVAMLLLFGTHWLAYTENVEDLLLNSCALGFVFAIDELIYCAFTPKRCMKVFETFTPVSVKLNGIQGHLAKILLVGSLVFVAIMYFIKVRPFVEKMQQTKDILCDGKLTFVYGINYLDRVFWVESLPYGKYMDRQIAMLEVVRAISHDHAGFVGNSSEFLSSGKDFTFMQQLTGPAFVNQYKKLCFDHPSKSSIYQIDEGYPKHAYDNIGLMLWALDGTSRYNKSLITCEDAIERFPLICDGRDTIGMFMRYSCPNLCGCADAASGIGETGDGEYGCPLEACAREIRLSLRSPPCEDTPFHVLTTSRKKQWENVVQFHLDTANDTFTNRQTLHPMLQYGCEGIRQLGSYLRYQVCHTIHGASIHCPQMCLCPLRSKYDEDGVRDRCPRSCFNSSVEQLDVGYAGYNANLR